MNVTTGLTTAILILLPGVVFPAFAQEHEQEKQPEQKQEKAKPQHRQQAKPANHTQQARRQPQAKPAQQHATRQQQAKPAKQAQRRVEQQRAGRSQPAGVHGRIPDERFRASFGRAHTFHVNRSAFANGPGRFRYGGFWFNAAQPLPAGWLYTDNVYVDYLNGGYFLCNPVHPGVYISLNIG